MCLLLGALHFESSKVETAKVKFPSLFFCHEDCRLPKNP